MISETLNRRYVDLHIVFIDNLDWKKAVLIAPDLRKMEEIKADEAKNGYIRVYDRAVFVNDSYGYKPTLAEVCCKYDDPDNCEVIMQDKGCVSAEDMADVKEFWNHIISMTD